MKVKLLILLFYVLTLSCLSQKDTFDSQVVTGSEGIKLNASLSRRASKQILMITLTNNTTTSIRVPELDTNTLMLTDENDSHVGLASNPGRKVKIIVLHSGETVSKEYEFPDGYFKSKELYLTYNARFNDVKNKPLRTKVTNK
jgi:hypothetical protein